MLSKPSEYEDTEFEDEFDDDSDEFEETEDQMVRPKLVANPLNVWYACKNSLPVWLILYLRDPCESIFSSKP